MKAKTPRILLVVNEGLHYSRQAALGIKRRIDSQDPAPEVSLFTSNSLGSKPGPRLTGAAGVVGFLSPDTVGRLQARGIPTVSVSESCRGICATVLPDNRAVGKLAGSYLAERGHKRIAFVDYHGGPQWSARRQALARAVEAAGGEFSEILWTGDVTPEVREQFRKVTAVMGSTDYCARRVIEVRSELGVQVPEDLAVLGVDNDTFACELCEVPLSSVDPNPSMIGYRAADLLLELLSGGTVSTSPVLVQPLGLAARRSTEMVAFEDPQIRQAMRYIAQHACDPMKIDEMMETMEVSRRTLEKRFRETVGRSILDEIRRVRFGRATHLLTQTSLSVSEISGRCGFNNHARFTSEFTRQFDMPPTEFRARNLSGVG